MAGQCQACTKPGLFRIGVILLCEDHTLALIVAKRKREAAIRERNRKRAAHLTDAHEVAEKAAGEKPRPVVRNARARTYREVGSAGLPTLGKR